MDGMRCDTPGLLSTAARYHKVMAPGTKRVPEEEILKRGAERYEFLPMAGANAQKLPGSVAA